MAKTILALLVVLLAAGAQDAFGADDSFELFDRALKMLSRGDATKALSLYQRAVARQNPPERDLLTFLGLR